MRLIVSALLVAGTVSASALESQVRSGGASGASPAVKACPLLTRDLVLPFSQNPTILDLLPPEEEPLGNSGSACEYGSVRLQLYAPRSGAVRKQPEGMQPLAGVGDLAYFRSNRDRYAELMVWTGVHYFTLQVGVPTGSTAEAIKPKTATLANQIIAKLK